MKKYMLMLKGRNFRIEIDGKLEKLGFYTTRWVEAQNPEDAELEALDLVRQDVSLKASVRNDRDDPPMIYLEELCEVERFEGINVPGAGYSFYPDKEEDEPSVNKSLKRDAAKGRRAP